MKNVVLITATAAFLLLALPATAQDVILPHRVIDMTTGEVVDFEGLLARCSEAQVVTFGEEHNDPATHLLELALLQGLFRRKGSVVLSMEMFERDVQGVLDSYLAGEITEEEFLASSRPWGNYETDYRPLVEFAREHGLPVVAANVPRPLAHRVAQHGYVNAEWTSEELQWISPRFEAPEDEYWEVFSETMSIAGMHGMGGVTPETVRQYYEAQVLKDETMADSVVKAVGNYPGATVLHITGSFHTLNYLGTFSRLRRDLPDADLLSLLAVPVQDLLAPLPEDTTKADYAILVLAPQEDAEEESSEGVSEEQ